MVHGIIIRLGRKMLAHYQIKGQHIKNCVAHGMRTLLILVLTKVARKTILQKPLKK